jgi:hypothetical protein
MSSSTNKLDNRLIDAETLLQQLNNEMAQLASALPAQRHSLEVDIDRRIAQLDDRLNRLSSDIRADRGHYEDELQHLRGQCTGIAAELQRKRAADDGRTAAGRLSDQAMLNQRRSEAITSTLDEAILLGTDGLRVGTLGMEILSTDRIVLEHTRENIEGIDDEALVGRVRAKRMLYRAPCGRFPAWIIVVILLALLGVEIWWKATRNK